MAQLPAEVKLVLDRCAHDLREVLVGVNVDQLKDKQWNELEEPAVEAGDWVARELLKALLEKQAEEVGESVETCPICGAALETRPNEPQPLQTRRGWLSWQQPVRHCSRCRRDFFPSGARRGARFAPPRSLEQPDSGPTVFPSPSSSTGLSVGSQRWFSRCQRAR